MQGFADCLAGADRRLVHRAGVLRATLEKERRRQGQQHQHAHHLHGRGPAQANDQRTGHRCHHELPERPTGIDDAGGHAALVRRDQAGRRRHQHGGPRHAGTTGRQHANGKDQSGRAGHERGDEGANGHQGHANEQHAPGTDPVGKGPGKRLGQPPPQLAKGKGQADAAHAQPGGRVECTQEQAHGLARAHGQRKGGGGRQQHQPDGQRLACGKRGGRFSHARLRYPIRWRPAKPGIPGSAHAGPAPAPGPASD